MDEPVYTDGINILRGHVGELVRVLEASFGYHDATDLARQFQNLGGVHRPSNLTKALNTQLERFKGYLLLEEEDVSEE